jgi:N-acyl homoserine lactone hydrolase
MLTGMARRMWALECPIVTVEAHTLMHGLTGKVAMPLPAFLIEHLNGLVLFDTGMDPDAMDDPIAVFGDQFGQHLLDNGWVCNSALRIDRQLQDLGYQTSDITHVITSHLHLDHCGGHHLFPKAKFYVGQDELSFAYWPTPMSSDAYLPWQLDRLRSLDWHEIPGIDVDLFGDGSLVILSMPGHTPGSLSLKVRLPSRTFILTGDAVHLRAALEKEYHFPIDSDTKASLATLRRIKLIRDAEDAAVWISHDPEDWAEYRHTPQCHE